MNHPFAYFRNAVGKPMAIDVRDISGVIESATTDTHSLIVLKNVKRDPIVVQRSFAENMEEIERVYEMLE